MYIFANVNNQTTMEYHENHEYWSKSFLNQFRKSPLHAWHYMHARKEATAAMRFGTMYHAFIDGTYQGRYVCDYEKCQEIGGASPRATKLYKEWVAEQTCEIVTVTEHEQVVAMIAQLRKNEIVQKINAFDLVQEQPFYAEIDGYKIKCKPDGMQLFRGKDKQHLLIDWKTTDKLEYIESTIYKYGYEVQAAMYSEIISLLHGGNETNFMFIFQEKTPPYDVLPVLVRWHVLGVKLAVQVAAKGIAQRLGGVLESLRVGNGYVTLQRPGREVLGRRGGHVFLQLKFFERHARAFQPLVSNRVEDRERSRYLHAVNHLHHRRHLPRPQAVKYPVKLCLNVANFQVLGIIGELVFLEVPRFWFAGNSFQEAVQ